MTAAKPNRAEFDYTPLSAKHIYIRQSTSKEPVELVIGHGKGNYLNYVLTREQLRALVRDSMNMYFASETVVK